MRNINAVTEIIFEKKDRPDLIRAFSDRFNLDDPGFPFAHLVYINNGSKHLLYARHGVSMELMKERPAFKEELSIFMDKFGKTGFGDILFFVSTYSHYPSIEAIFSKKFSKNEFIDYFTRDSYGYLTWQYQLEHMIMAIQPSMDCETVGKLVLGIQTGKSWAIETAKKLSIGSDNLYDILQERGLCNVSFVGGCPEFGDALMLYKAIKGYPELWSEADSKCR